MNDSEVVFCHGVLSLYSRGLVRTEAVWKSKWGQNVGSSLTLALFGKFLGAVVVDRAAAGIPTPCYTPQSLSAQGVFVRFDKNDLLPVKIERLRGWTH